MDYSVIYKSQTDNAEWAREFQSAYDDLCRRVDDGEDTAIAPYATESPVEFFAVLFEYFFARLMCCGTAVYGLLARFYRQDPLARLS